MDDTEGELVQFRKKHPVQVVASKPPAVKQTEPIIFTTVIDGNRIKALMTTTWEAGVVSISNNNDNEALTNG